MKRCGLVAWAFLVASAGSCSGTSGVGGPGDAGGDIDVSNAQECALKAAAIVQEAARINSCAWMKECVDNPTGICNIPELPCGQVWMKVATPENTIDELGAAYIQAGCNGSCNCPEPPETLFCIDGTCRATASCPEILARIDALKSAPGATQCAADADCVAGYSDKSPLCAPADACFCTFALGSTYMSEVQELIDIAAGQGCTTMAPVCECIAEDCKTRTPKCTGGQCEMVYGH